MTSQHCIYYPAVRFIIVLNGNNEYLDNRMLVLSLSIGMDSITSRYNHAITYSGSSRHISSAVSSQIQARYDFD